MYKSLHLPTIINMNYVFENIHKVSLQKSVIYKRKYQALAGCKN